jgi:ATP sulfurylase
MIKFGNSGKIILGLVNLEHLVFVVLEKKIKKGVKFKYPICFEVRKETKKLRG